MKKSLTRLGVGLVAALSMAWSTVALVPAEADTRPPNPSDPKTPVTVAADPLPTVQIDGVAWTQRVIGNTVYVGGRFTTARPAGAAAGTQTTARANLLAYDIRTGDLITALGADHQRRRALDRAVAGQHPALHRRQLHHGQRADPQPDRRPGPGHRRSDRLLPAEAGRHRPGHRGHQRHRLLRRSAQRGRRRRPDPRGLRSGRPTARCCPGRRTPRAAACTRWPCRPTAAS